MKRIILVLTAALVMAAGLYAQESDVVYIEGWVDVKDSSGDTYELFIGDRVLFGDTIITSWDGVAELEPEHGSRIIVKPDTVFSIKETDIGGKKQSVVSTTLGQVSFKFNRMTQEPMISTPSTVMGVRGTEFTVYAGADGSSLVTVESGAVEVSSLGESVLLEKDEGVEVATGSAPGEKFKVMGKAIDFSEWNSGKVDSMMEDPLNALGRLTTQLEGMIMQTEEWSGLFDDGEDDITRLRDEMNALFDDGKDADAQELYKKQLRPLELTSLKYAMNYRYYALSALSMRQHILSGFYVRMKTAYINDRTNPIYKEFMEAYNELIKDFEQRVTPMLVEADY